MNGKVYMDVPYGEKEIVKSLGARWDPKIKKWYYEGPVDDYISFAKWISCGREKTIIAYEYIHIIEGLQTCFKCKKPTRVVGFGIGEHISLFEYDDNLYEIEIVEDLVGCEWFHLAWTSDEQAIPPA